MIILVLFLSRVVFVWSLPGNDNTIEDLVKHYFRLSFTIDEIVGFLLFSHHIVTSRTTVKRILKRLGLRRYGVESRLEVIVQKILELHSTGYMDLGYKALWKVLNSICNVRVGQETVRIALKIIDPDGVHLRSQHRLRRRQYTSKGPNYVIHIDGYDKLKPFGIAIHGCVDGYSRRILWLKAGPTNNNPYVTARCFVDYLREIKSVPRMVRCDRGSENVVIKDIQICLRSFHTDTMSGTKSFSEGRSTANQRIEMFWGCLKKHFTQFWRNKFKDMIDANVFNNADPTPHPVHQI